MLFDEQAPFAIPQLDPGRTLKDLECCYDQGLSWEAEQQIQGYLQQEECLAKGSSDSSSKPNRSFSRG